VDFTRHCRFQFGEYVQAHEEHDNTMAPRTIGALALHPTGNAQGSFYFFSLSTGRMITHGRATALPRPDDVIDQVHRIARQKKANLGMLFEDCNNMPIPGDQDLPDNDSEADDSDYDDDDDDDDSDYNDNNLGQPAIRANLAGVHNGANNNDFNDADYYDNDVVDNDYEEEITGVQDDDEEITGVHNEDNDDDDDAADNDYEEEIVGVQDNEEEIAGVHEEELNNEDEMEVNPQGEKQENEDMEEDNGNDHDNYNNNTINNEMDTKYGARSGRHNLRTRKPRDFLHLFANAEHRPHGETEQANEPKQNTMLETHQMNMQQGIRVFGEKGVKAVKKQMLQLHERKVMRIEDPRELTYEQKKEVLAYLMFLKRNDVAKSGDKDAPMGKNKGRFLPHSGN